MPKVGDSTLRVQIFVELNLRPSSPPSTAPPKPEPPKQMLRWVMYELVGEMLEQFSTIIACAVAAIISFIGSYKGLTMDAGAHEPAIILLCVGPLAAAIIQPRAPWRWPLIPGLLMPMAYYLAEEIIHVEARLDWTTNEAAVAFVLPFAAAYVGAGVRLVLRFAFRKIAKALNLAPKVAPAARSAARVPAQSTT